MTSPSEGVWDVLVGKGTATRTIPRSCGSRPNPSGVAPPVAGRFARARGEPVGPEDTMAIGVESVKGSRATTHVDGAVGPDCRRSLDPVANSVLPLLGAVWIDGV